MESGSRIYKRDPKSRKVSTAKPAPRVRPERSGPFHVEIISVGREILRGQVADRNARYLAGRLSRAGTVVHRMTVVDDNDRVITAAVTEAVKRGVNLIITTGGLGPTSDDVTLGGVADALGVPLAINHHAKEMVEEACSRLKNEGKISHSGMTRAREKMCAIPVGSEPLKNEGGIAPGIITKLAGGATIVCLPGVPDEMRAVWAVTEPRIRELQSDMVKARREVEAPTADESILQPWLDKLHAEFPNVWIKSHSSGFGKKVKGIRVTFEAYAPTAHEAELAVEGALRRLLAMAGAG